MLTDYKQNYNKEIENRPKMFAVLEQNDDFIQLNGIYDYYTALGHITCLMADDIDDLVKRNEYEITERKDFARLEGDTGYLWFIMFVNKEHGITIKQRYYLLRIGE